MKFSNENSQIAAALSKSWAAMNSITNAKTVNIQTKKGSYSFSYADLGSLFEVAREVFTPNKISVHQNASTEDYNGRLMVIVETTFLHESGEWMTTSPLRYPIAQDMKELGSQITYMKRYSLAAALGVSTESPQQQQQPNQYPKQRQQQQVRQNAQQPKVQNRNSEQQPQKPAANADGERLATDQQKQRIENGIRVIAGDDRAAINNLMNAAYKATNIPNRQSYKDLTFTDASAVLFWLTDVYRQKESEQAVEK